MDMRKILSAVLLAAGVAGCAEPAPDPNGPVVAYDNLTGPVRIAIDPVSHDEVRTDSAWRSTYRGRTYYFGTLLTLHRFEADPAAYVTEEGRIK